MSNIAVSKLAMKAAVIGSENLEGFLQFGAKGQTYQSWLPTRIMPAPADLLSIDERRIEERSQPFANESQPCVASRTGRTHPVASTRV